MSHRSRSPVPLFFSFSSGGVPAGIIEGHIVAEIEKNIGRPISQLSDKTGVYASSAGGLIAGAVFAAEKIGSPTPLYSGQQALDIFKDQCPKWLPEPIKYHDQLLASLGIKIPFSKSAFFYDENCIQKSLQDCFGDITLENMLSDFFMPGHNNSAKRASEQAILFYKIQDRDGTTRYHLSRDMKFVKLIKAGTAVPGNMVSETIENVGSVCDYGHLNDSHVALIEFYKTLPEGTKPHYIEIGPPRYHNHIPDTKVDQLGLFRRAPDLARNTATHSYSANLRHACALLGTENVHDLSPDINMQLTPKDKLSRSSIFDTTPAHIARLEEMAAAYVKEDSFLRTCDFLAENAALCGKPRLETVSVAAIYKASSSKLSGIFGLRPKTQPGPFPSFEPPAGFQPNPA